MRPQFFLLLLGLALLLGGGLLTLDSRPALAQSVDDGPLGIWSGYVPCRGRESANTTLRITERRIADGGYSGLLIFNGTSISAKSQDGLNFQPERNALSSVYASPFSVRRIGHDEVEIRTSGTPCATTSPLARARDDIVDEVFYFQAGGPLEWAGKSPLAAVAGRDFFDAVLADRTSADDASLAAQLTRWRSECTFESVGVQPFRVTRGAFFLRVGVDYLAIGAKGVCRDGSNVALTATSEPMVFDKRLGIGTPRLCTSRPQASSFESCWIDPTRRRRVCTNAESPPDFSCSGDLLRTVSEGSLAEARSLPEECVTTTTTQCDVTSTGVQLNCKPVSTTSCSGGPNTQRGAPLEPTSVRAGPWSPPGDPVRRVVDMPGGQFGAPGTCPLSFERRRGRSEALRCYCPPSKAVKNFWGGEQGVYTDNSFICGAARHAGALTGQGLVTVRPAAGNAGALETVRNGQKALATDAFEFGFTVEAAAASPSAAAGAFRPGPAPDAVAAARTLRPADRCPDTFEAIAGDNPPLTCSCREQVDLYDNVWGDADGTYQAASYICTAAVHAGVLDYRAGGRVKITPVPARRNWSGSQANGVTARSSDEEEIGFRIEAATPDAPTL